MQENHDKHLADQVLASQDHRAFEILADAYRASLRRLLLTKLPTLADAEDLLSEVFTRAWEYMTSTEVEHPKALFFRIAKNLIADFYRTRHEMVRDETFFADLAGEAALDKELEQRDQVERLLKIVDTLKPEYKEVLRMYAVAELDIRQIAQLLGKTTNNVRVLLFRARHALKKKL